MTAVMTHNSKLPSSLFLKALTVPTRKSFGEISLYVRQSVLLLTYYIIMMYSYHKTCKLVFFVCKIHSVNSTNLVLEVIAFVGGCLFGELVNLSELFADSIVVMHLRPEVMPAITRKYSISWRNYFGFKC